MEVIYVRERDREPRERDKRPRVNRERRRRRRTVYYRTHKTRQEPPRRWALCAVSCNYVSTDCVGTLCAGTGTRVALWLHAGWAGVLAHEKREALVTAHVSTVQGGPPV